MEHLISNDSPKKIIETRQSPERLKPLKKHIYKTKEGKELPGWKYVISDSEFNFPLDVKKPYFVDHRSELNTQPRYPHSPCFPEIAPVPVHAKRSFKQSPKVVLQAHLQKLEFSNSLTYSQSDSSALRFLSGSGSTSKHSLPFLYMRDHQKLSLNTIQSEDNPFTSPAGKEYSRFHCAESPIETKPKMFLLSLFLSDFIQRFFIKVKYEEIKRNGLNSDLQAINPTPSTTNGLINTFSHISHSENISPQIIHNFLNHDKVDEALDPESPFVKDPHYYAYNAPQEQADEMSAEFYENTIISRDQDAIHHSKPSRLGLVLNNNEEEHTKDKNPGYQPQENELNFDGVKIDAIGSKNQRQIEKLVYKPDNRPIDKIQDILGGNIKYEIDQNIFDQSSSHSQPRILEKKLDRFLDKSLEMPGINKLNCLGKTQRGNFLEKSEAMNEQEIDIDNEEYEQIISKINNKFAENNRGKNNKMPDIETGTNNKIPDTETGTKNTLVENEVEKRNKVVRRINKYVSDTQSNNKIPKIVSSNNLPKKSKSIKPERPGTNAKKTLSTPKNAALQTAKAGNRRTNILEKHISNAAAQSEKNFNKRYSKNTGFLSNFIPRPSRSRVPTYKLSEDSQNESSYSSEVEDFDHKPRRKNTKARKTDLFVWKVQNNAKPRRSMFPGKIDNFDRKTNKRQREDSKSSRKVSTKSYKVSTFQARNDRKGKNKANLEVSSDEESKDKGKDLLSEITSTEKENSSKDLSNPNASRPFSALNAFVRNFSKTLYKSITLILVSNKVKTRKIQPHRVSYIYKRLAEQNIIVSKKKMNKPSTNRRKTIRRSLKDSENPRSRKHSHKEFSDYSDDEPLNEISRPLERYEFYKSRLRYELKHMNFMGNLAKEIAEPDEKNDDEELLRALPDVRNELEGIFKDKSTKTQMFNYSPIIKFKVPGSMEKLNGDAHADIVSYIDKDNLDAFMLKEKFMELRQKQNFIFDQDLKVFVIEKDKTDPQEKKNLKKVELIKYLKREKCLEKRGENPIATIGGKPLVTFTNLDQDFLIKYRHLNRKPYTAGHNSRQKLGKANFEFSSKLLLSVDEAISELRNVNPNIVVKSSKEL